jgi:nitroreductase
MEVLKAIQARHSVRDFDPRPVPKDTVMKILEAATRSPSGGNSQPWEIFVASGDTMEVIRKVYQERAQAMTGGPGGLGGPGGPGRFNGPGGPGRPGGPGGTGGPGSPGGPPPMPAFIMERMATIRNERMKLLGLDPDDPASFKVFMSWGARIYGAPVMAVICMDRALSSNFDLGSLSQTICLAAQDFGVDSLIASGFIAHQDVLRKELEIPDSLNIVIGIGLGYAKPNSIINTYRSPRRPIDEVVRYRG